MPPRALLALPALDPRTTIPEAEVSEILVHIDGRLKWLAKWRGLTNSIRSSPIGQSNRMSTKENASLATWVCRLEYRKIVGGMHPD